MKILLNIVLQCIALIFLSCAGSTRVVHPNPDRERPLQPLPDRELYRQLSDKGDWLDAYVQLMRLPPSGLAWSQGEQQRLTDEMEQSYRRIEEGSDWRNWLRWHQSLAHLGLLQPPQLYWEGLFSYYRRQKQTGPALAIVQQARMALPDFQPSTEMATLLKGQWHEVKSPDELLLATALVEVDLGLETQQGIGVPKSEVGSGFFLDKDGYLLTNYHVIAATVDPKYEGFAKAYLRLHWQDGRIPAQVVGWDKERDLALLKAAVVPLVVLPLSSEALQSGETVFAVGAPGGLASSISRGALSSRSRQLLPLTDVLQIDTPLSPGNSGGPLLNQRNEVVGVVFLKVAATGFEGLGFAIPTRIVLKVLPALYAGGKVRNSWLGVIADESKEGRVEVRYVVPGSPADRGGVEEGDRLLSFNNQAVSSIAAALASVPFLEKGALFRLEVERKGKALQLYALADERWESPVERLIDLDSSSNLFYAFFGAKLELVGTPNRFRVGKVLPDSMADNYGLDRGDLVELQWLIVEEQKHLLVLASATGRRSGQVETRLLLGSPLDFYRIL